MQSSTSNDEGWIDATQLFREGCSDLKQGEILHGQHFSLFDAMSAIQIGEPRMDSGALLLPGGVEVEKGHLHGPKELDESQVIGIMDELLRCEASWHSGNALTSNLLRCLYVHEFDGSEVKTAHEDKNIVSVVLMPYVLATCRTVFLAWRELSQGYVYDGEDIILERFGVPLADEAQDDYLQRLLNEAETWIGKLADSPIKDSLLARIRFRIRLLECFVLWDPLADDPLTMASSDVLPSALQLLNGILASSHLGRPVPEAFDNTISGRLVGSLPPRPSILAELPQAVNCLQRLLEGFAISLEIAGLRKILVIEEALCNLSTSRPPLPAFTRSTMQTMLCSPAGRFTVMSPEQFISIILQEYGFSGVSQSLLSTYSRTSLSDYENSQLGNFHRAQQIYLDLISFLLHNLPRQRRNLGKLLEHIISLSSEVKDQAQSSPPELAKAIAVFIFWLDHIKHFVTAKILKDGFELDLYSQHEYPSMLWCTVQALFTTRSHLEKWQLAASGFMDRSSHQLEVMTAITNVNYLTFDALSKVALLIGHSQRQELTQAQRGQEEAAFNRRIHVLCTIVFGQPFTFHDWISARNRMLKQGSQLLIKDARSSLSLAGISSDRAFKASAKERDYVPTLHAIKESREMTLRQIIVGNLNYLETSGDESSFSKSEWSQAEGNGHGQPLIPRTLVHVLVTNDDGPPNEAESPFIVDFVRSLRETLGWRVSVVIPSSQKSWISKAFHIKDPVHTSWLYLDHKGKQMDRTDQRRPASATQGDDEWILLDGTPSTCVNIGLHHFCKDEKIDLVLAGPNYGRNTSTAFALSSGTVGAAIEGSLCGVPSIALSYGVVVKPIPEGIPDVAHKVSIRTIKQLWDTWPDRHGRAAESVAFYNVNVPLVTSLNERTEVRWTKMHRSQYGRLFKVAQSEAAAELEKSGTKAPATWEARREDGTPEGQETQKAGEGPADKANTPASIEQQATLRNGGHSISGATAQANERLQRLTFVFAPDITPLIAAKQDLPLDTDARALQTDCVVSVTAMRTGYDEVPLHLARQQADLNHGAGNSSSLPLRLRGGSFTEAAATLAAPVTHRGTADYEPLSNTLKPLTDATLTVRVIRSFEYRNQRSVVLHHINLQDTKLKDLLEVVKEHIEKDIKFKPFRAYVDKYDTFKIYTQAHKTKTQNLIINLEDGSILDDLDRTLVSYGLEHESEISLFNREAYDAFRLNPQVKWD